MSQNHKQRGRRRIALRRISLTICKSAAMDRKNSATAIDAGTAQSPRISGQRSRLTSVNSASTQLPHQVEAKEQPVWLIRGGIVEIRRASSCTLGHNRARAI